MKNIKTILIIIFAAAFGLGAGYFLFGKNQEMSMPSDHHNHSEETTTNATGEAEIWTCSMHPQIQQDGPGECPLCGMDLIPLDKNSSSDPLVLEMTPEAVKLANIQTTIVGEGKAGSASSKTIRLSGKVQTDERLASSQVAHVPGRIEKLFVSFTGEKVSQGQKIATIYSPELITAQSELLEAIKLQEINPNLVEAARNKLRYWKIGKNTIEAIEQNGTIQEVFTLYADESGIITNRRVAVGDYLKRGEPLFDLVNLSKVWVLFDAYEKDLAAVSVGDRIEFTTPSMPNKTFKTRVTFIDPVINPQTRVASIRTEINNRYGHLKPEMFVNGILKNKTFTKSKTNLTVPKSAVLWTGTRSVVYVKVPDMTIPSFQFREIELGEAMGGNYRVMSGLEAGEEVVTYGSFSIDASAQLNNQTSMMNQNVMVKGVEDTEQLPDYTESTPLEFKQQLAKVVDAYFLLKDALVATNVPNAKTAAQEIVKALPQVDMKLLKGDAHMYWMEQLDALNAHSEKITTLDDVEAQRRQFDFFSQALIKAVKVFGITENTLYVDHCPMANENKGANWLSKEEKIFNPYFGEKMLTCGSIQETITKE